MTETVVHVKTIEQWKSVLNVWFEKGYEWFVSGDSYQETYYSNRSNQLALNIHGAGEITCFIHNDYHGDSLIEYADFMAKKEKTMAKETYYVTQEQLDLINELKGLAFPMANLIDNQDNRYDSLKSGVALDEELSILRYLGGDKSVELKVKKEQLYRLWRINREDEKSWFVLSYGTEPDWIETPDYAFTAPREEIEKWQTPAWEIEEVK